MENHLSVDLETFSSVDIKKAGLYKYVQAPDFQILLLAFSLNGGQVQVLDLARGDNPPARLQQLLFSPECVKHAYNAVFEWHCLSKYFSCKAPEAWLAQWRCTMLHSLYCGYPAGLEMTGAALGLPEEKRKLSTGRTLIKLFCTPCTPTSKNGRRIRTLPQQESEKWALFKRYNAQDVVTEMEIERLLSAFPVPDDVQKQWELDQIINARGVALDSRLVDGALQCSQAVTARLTEEATRISGLQNPNSVAQLTSWLIRETGEDIADLRKETVKDMLGENPDNTAVRRMLEIRQELSKTSVKKYTAMSSIRCDDGRARGLLQFYGANRTGRWAGRFLQPQNLPRTHLESIPLARELVKECRVDDLDMCYGSVPDTLSQLIRTALIPSPGNLFVDADFSAIEARVIAWLAGEEWVLDVFRTHGRIYEACAAQMFGVSMDRIAKGNPEYDLRQKGKVATLALGYQGGVGALIQMGALRMGLAEDELPDIVRRWRASNKRIVDLWYAIENAAIFAMRTGASITVRYVTLACEFDPVSEQDFLTIALPSGRKLFYVRPFLAQNQFGRDGLRYWGMNQTTHKWEVTDTYGGKLVENIVQAIARDCLAESIAALELAGYPVVFHVHDEIITEMPEGVAAFEDVCTIMSRQLSWAPGLPLKADGWVGAYYTKD